MYKVIITAIAVIAAIGIMAPGAANAVFQTHNGVNANGAHGTNANGGAGQNGGIGGAGQAGGVGGNGGSNCIPSPC